MYTLRDLVPESFTILAPQDLRPRLVRLGTLEQGILLKAGKKIGFADDKVLNSAEAGLSSTEKLERMMGNAALNRNRFDLFKETGLSTLRELEAVMVAMMVKSEGVGLAAQQIGLDLRAFVMGTEAFPDPARWPSYKPKLFVDPELLDVDRETLAEWESCLSITNDLKFELPDAVSPMVYLMAKEWKDSIHITHTTALVPPGVKETIQVDKRLQGNLFGLVNRPRSIRVRYHDADGVRHEERLEGWMARIWLHEFDHLNGVIYPMRVKRDKTIMTLSNTSREAKDGIRVDVDKVMEFLQGNIPGITMDRLL